MASNERLQTGDPGYDPSDGSYHLHHDWDTEEPLSYTVMELILALTGEDSRTCSPLVESIDPDALDQLFAPRQSKRHPYDSVTFSHEDCRVTVLRDGHVFAYPPESHREWQLGDCDGDG